MNDSRLRLTGAALVVATLSIPLVAAGGVDPAGLRPELERIEDVRILHRYGVQDLHDARTLAIYLHGWGGPDRQREVEDLFVEAEGVYGAARAIDHGGKGLQAQIDALGKETASAAQLALLERARRTVARQVMDLHRRCGALKAELARQVTAAAKAKIHWTVTSKPQPWSVAAREAGRRKGLRYGRLMDQWFFDQVPEADRDYVLAKSRKMGYAFANVLWRPASNWGDIERKPGRYDFAALDRIVARLARHGMTVALMLQSLTGGPPKWLISRYGPACQFRAPIRRRDPKTGQWEQVKAPVGINLLHEPTGKAFARFLTAYAAHCKAKWPGQVEGIYIEGGQREIGAVADESKAMDAYWRRWSRSQTPWRTPESIAAAKPFDAPAYAKAQMCREAWLLDYVRAVRAALKAGWADLPVNNETFSDDFHRMFASAVGESRDAWALAGLADHPGSASDSPANLTLLHSFARGRWLWQQGVHSGCGVTAGAAGTQPAFYDATRIVIGWAHWGVRSYFPASWFRYADGQIGDFGVGSFYLTPRRSQQYGPALLNTGIARSPLAVLWSETTLRLDRTRAFWKSAMACGHLLRRAFFQFDYLPEAGLAERLRNCRVLILPNTQALTAGVCEAIRTWVAGGGRLIAFGAPGIFDASGRRRAGSPLADVFGADVARMRVPGPLHPQKLYTGHPEGAYIRPAPNPWQYESDMTAALKLAGAKAVSWYAGTAKEVAIAEHTFGKGRAMLSGYPVAYCYREAAPYEFAYGLSHSRTLSYNIEQNRYEQWITGVLTRAGITREVFVPSGRFLRAQLRDDGDWLHIFSNGPKYQEYLWEDERPARTIAAVARRREGVEGLTVCLLNTEGNYFWQRGYFRSTLGGGRVTVSAAVGRRAGAKAGPVVFDVRLRVPVPSTTRGRRAQFDTWVPTAQGSVFAVAPSGEVRLFGPATVRGDAPEAVAARVATYAAGEAMAKVELLEPKRIAAFLEARRGKALVIGCGNRRFKPAAETLARWLKAAYGIRATITTAGRRCTIRKAYMDGFGYNRPLPEPVHADILVGNCQDNGLMYRFLLLSGQRYWLPLEVNQDFPGQGRAVVALSLPVATPESGRPGGKKTPQQLVLGASFPAEASLAVEALTAAMR